MNGTFLLSTLDASRRLYRSGKTPRAHGLGRRWPSVLALTLAGLCWLSSIPFTLAGTLTTDFSKDVGVSIANKPEITTLVRDGILKLVDLNDLIDPATGQYTEQLLPLQGSYILPEIDPGKRVASFTATFTVRVGGGTEIGGMGFSLVLANDFPDSIPFRESGGSSTGLIISFDQVDGLADGFAEGNDLGDAPGIIIKQQGQKIVAKRFTGLRTDPAGQGHAAVFVPVAVKLTEDGLLSVAYNGTNVYDNVPIGYIPIQGSFGFGAGTEGQLGATRDNFWMDDLAISTTTVSSPYVVSVEPPAQNASPDAAIRIGVQDLGAAVVQLQLDNQTVNSITTDAGGGVSIVSFSASKLFDPSSSHTVKLSYGAKAFNYVFTVANAPFVPATAAAAPGSVDTTKSGFKVRVYQTAAAQTDTSPDGADKELAGQLGANIADLSGAGPDHSFLRDTINVDSAPADSGQVPGDQAIPGIPGTTSSSDNLALEIIGYLDLKAGPYTLGAIASDGGVRVSIGSDPRDVTSLRLINSTAGGGTASFIIQQPGIYPVRVLWAHSSGAANLELWTQDAAGNKTLLNDRSTAAGIKTYAEHAAGFQPTPYVSFASPGPGDQDVSRRPQINLALTDGSTSIDPSSIKLSINDSVVMISAGAVAKTGSTTIIKFDLPQLLDPTALQNLKLEFTDSAGTTATRTYSFTTGKSSGASLVNAVKGYWNFDHGLKAGVGRDLEYVDPSLASRYKVGVTGQGDLASVPLINGKPATVLFVPYVPDAETDAKGAIFKRIGLRMKHGIAPNGGGQKVNQYTVILDLLWGENGAGVNYGAVWQLHDLDNPVDSDMYWQGSSGHYGKTGASAYAPGTAQQARNEWARVAFAVDLAANPPILAKYINGIKEMDQITGTRGHIDSEFAMSIPEIVLFGDSDNETSDAYVSAVQVREGRMSDDEVAALGGPDAAGIPLPYSQWDFNDPSNPLAATVGNDLNYVDPLLASRYKAGITGQGDLTNVPSINGKPAGVLFVPYVADSETDAKGAIFKRLGLRLNHGLAPNGGGQKVNQYTVILDLLWGENGAGVNYGALWQLHDLDNPVDSDMYWQGSSGHYGKTGASAYAPGTAQQARNEWARVAFAVDLAANPPILAKYINGIKEMDQITGTRGHIDSEFAFSRPEIILFGDSDNENSDAIISSLQVRQGRMSDDEVAALGGADAAGIPTPNPVKGEWNFDDSSKPLAATVGNDLAYVDPSLANRYKVGVTGQGDLVSVPLINGKPATVLFVPYVPDAETDAKGAIFKRIGLRMKHGIAPNGGGQKVNQYTVILDLLWGENGAGVNYGAVWQLHDLDNPVDSDMYWQGSSGHYGKTGASAYAPGTAQQARNEWARVAFAVDLAANPPILAKYINGIKEMDQITGTRGHIDSEFAMSIPEIVLFGDSDNETSDAYVNAVQVREGRMSDDEVAALGGPDAAGIPSASIGNAGSVVTAPPATSPKLIVALNSPNLTLSWDVAAVGFALESTDRIGGTWAQVGGVANNQVTVQIGPGTRFYRLRK